MSVVRIPGSFFLHDPDAFEPLGCDWTEWLQEIGGAEVLSLSTWDFTGPDSALVLSLASIVSGLLRTQVKISVGTVGARYRVTNHITSSSGYKEDCSFEILVRQK